MPIIFVSGALSLASASVGSAAAAASKANRNGFINVSDRR
jgi:hypothetical protein